MVVVLKILEALVTSRYLKKKKTNYSVQRPQAMQGTEHVLYKHLMLSPGGDSRPENLPKPQTGPCAQGRESGEGSHALCQLGGRGLPAVAGNSQENRPPCPLWTAPIHTCPAYPFHSLGPPGKPDQGQLGPSRGPGRLWFNIRLWRKTAGKELGADGPRGISQTGARWQEKGASKTSPCSLRSGSPGYQVPQGEVVPGPRPASHT